MSQHVWEFFVSNDPGASESWTVRWLSLQLNMPESTVRGQIRRLEETGRIERRKAPGGGRILFRKVT